MSRKGWIYTADGKVFEKGTQDYFEHLAEANAHASFIPDETDFKSPIDGKLYSGRAGMREHNARHNVVSNRDLSGLPTLTTHRPPPADTAARRETIIQAARARGLL